MVFPKEREKKEGLIGTIVFHLMLLVLFLFYGLTHTVPIPETGLTVNFGTSEMGSGDVQPDVSGTPAEEQPDPVEDPAPVDADASESESTPDVATQDDVETIEAKKVKTPEEIEAEKVAAEKAEKERQQEEFRKKMQQTTDALKSNNNPTGGGEGPDDEPGDKGQTDGQKDGGAYKGGGIGSGNYSLDGRAALTKPKPVYDCQEEGKVVIDIKVDRNGKVKYASVGKGTTNTAECLTQKAIQAAYKTKWQAKDGAPIEQRGEIIYHFILQ